VGGERDGEALELRLKQMWCSDGVRAGAKSLHERGSLKGGR
jgi:hypothetical protein